MKTLGNQINCRMEISSFAAKIIIYIPKILVYLVCPSYVEEFGTAKELNYIIRYIHLSESYIKIIRISKLPYCTVKNYLKIYDKSRDITRKIATKDFLDWEVKDVTIVCWYTLYDRSKNEMRISNTSKLFPI